VKRGTEQLACRSTVEKRR